MNTAETWDYHTEYNGSFPRRYINISVKEKNVYLQPLVNKAKMSETLKVPNVSLPHGRLTIHSKRFMGKCRKTN